MKWLRVVALAVVVAFAAAGVGSTVASSRKAEGKDVVEHFSFDGQQRSYLLHLPSRLDKKKPVPLVLVLHYYTGTGRAEAQQTQFSEKADAEHFIAVYPDGPIPAGPGLSWNVWHNPRDAGGSRDVAFVRELIRRLSARFAIDPKRIYVTGMSQGGMVSHLAGCELSSVVAAIAPVSGFMMEMPKSADPVSVLIIHGTDDAVVPYMGGTLGGGRGRGGGARGRGGPGQRRGPMGARPIPPVSEEVAAWVAHNGCSPKPERTQHGKVIREVYSGGRGETEVVLCTVVGGGHNWPGDRNDKTISGMNGTDAIWEFFVHHPKR
jgi:polyhydroxybutyrate depolymerase